MWHYLVSTRTNIYLYTKELTMSDLHTVDCDAEPFVPNDLKVEEHKEGGQLQLDPSKVKLHLSSNQMVGRVIEGNKLRKELESEPVLNANVLDYLFTHQELIPEDWKCDAKGNTRYIFFWGTIYRDSRGDLFIRCLYWDGGAWHQRSYRLGRDWDGRSPATVLAS